MNFSIGLIKTKRGFVAFVTYPTGAKLGKIQNVLRDLTKLLKQETEAN